MDIFSILERAEGFSKTVAAAGAVEVSVPHATEPTPTANEGSRLMRRLLDSKRPLPTAVFAHNDLMAIGALATLKERGLRCPEDISLIGYHDLPQVGHITPPLTTVRQPQDDLGRTAAEMTIGLLDGQRERLQWRRLAPALIVRESTAPL
jgi:LacI family transcriptional regulator